MAGSTVGSAITEPHPTGSHRPPPPSFDQRVRRWFVDWSLALPLIVTFGTVLIAPALVLVHQSLTDDNGAFTLDNWRDTLAMLSTRWAVAHSLLLALTAASAVTVVGAPVTWMISRMAAQRQVLAVGLLNIATNLSGISLGFAYVASLGTYGMVTLGLHYIGVSVTPPDQGAFTGLVLAFFYANLPLFILMALPAMTLVRDEWWEAAETSAATRLQFWRYIGWPLLRPFLIADWLSIFTWSVGLYGLPVALIGDRPGAYRLITLEMSKSLQGSLLGVRTMPVYAVILIAIAFISLWLCRAALRRGMRWLT